MRSPTKRRPKGKPDRTTHWEWRAAGKGKFPGPPIPFLHRPPNRPGPTAQRSGDVRRAGPDHPSSTEASPSILILPLLLGPRPLIHGRNPSWSLSFPSHFPPAPLGALRTKHPSPPLLPYRAFSTCVLGVHTLQDLRLSLPRGQADPSILRGNPSISNQIAQALGSDRVGLESGFSYLPAKWLES